MASHGPTRCQPRLWHRVYLRGLRGFRRREARLGDEDAVHGLSKGLSRLFQWFFVGFFPDHWASKCIKYIEVDIIQIIQIAFYCFIYFSLSKIEGVPYFFFPLHQFQVQASLLENGENQIWFCHGKYGKTCGNPWFSSRVPKLACQLWAKPLLAPFSREFSHELAMGLAAGIHDFTTGRLVQKLQENHMRPWCFLATVTTVYTGFSCDFFLKPIS